MSTLKTTKTTMPQTQALTPKTKTLIFSSTALVTMGTTNFSKRMAICLKTLISSSTARTVDVDVDVVVEEEEEAVIGVTPIVATMPARIKFYLGIRKPTATNAETWMNSVTGKLTRFTFTNTSFHSSPLLISIT